MYTFNGRGGSATVFGATNASVVATIPLKGKPEAAAYDAAAGRIYVNIEDTGEVAAIDTAAHTVAARWPLTGCEEPSGLALDAAHHHTYSVCDNGVMVALDTTSGRVVGTAPIGKRPDGAAYQSGDGRHLQLERRGHADRGSVGERGPLRGADREDATVGTYHRTRS